jgi:hypothetical protein
MIIKIQISKHLNFNTKTTPIIIGKQLTTYNYFITTTKLIPHQIVHEIIGGK